MKFIFSWSETIHATLSYLLLTQTYLFVTAVIEHRKQIELNAMIENAAQAADHRSKNKIVERIYSDVKGLKSVLRKSRRGTK